MFIHLAVESGYLILSELYQEMGPFFIFILFYFINMINEQRRKYAAGEI